MNFKPLILVLLLLGLGACAPNQPVEEVSPPLSSPSSQNPASTPVALPNPASVNCAEQGYTLEMREGEGGTYGVCLFPDGSECEEWAYFRGECQPGDSLVPPTSSPAAAASAAPGEAGWQLYENATPPYTFLYPADATIEPGNDPQQTVTILGPLAADEYWPVIYISHPQDRPEFSPPVGVELAQWLGEQGLLMVDEQSGTAEVRQADRMIAGETAVHTRFERSPQSYAYDKYLFAHAGQLYSIVILHAGDKEDWDLYNQILDSFQFADR